MNGIILLTLSVALQGDVAFQSGIEFGWTQLPDNRVEYIIQLDDKALDALKSGQPLTSSIPPEIQSADRIRIQYGSGVLARPVLSRKPQSTPWGGRTIADTPPALNRNDLQNQPQAVPGYSSLSGQVTVKNGNLNSVSNSSLSGTRQTAFVTQETGTNNAIPSHWSNSNRVIGNYDNQNRANANRTATTQPLNNRSLAPTGTNIGGTTNPNVASNNPGAAPINNTNSTMTNPTGAGFGQGTATNNTGFTGNSGAGNNTGFAGNNVSQPTGQGTTGFGGNGMSPVPNRNLNNTGWTSVTNPNQTNTNFRNQGNTNLNGGMLNPNAINPNLMTGGNRNAIPQNNLVNNGFPNAQNYVTQPNPNLTNPNLVAQPNPNLVAQPSVSMPVTTAVPSNEVAMLNKTIEEMKNNQRQRDHEQEISKLKADQKAELEKLAAEVKEFQKKRETTPATTPTVKADDSDSKRGNSSGIASVFLVISLGLNVFLVVQYLSVQNQFRDLSNDLRDTFMTNSYE